MERNLHYQYVDETESLHTVKGKPNYRDYIIKKVPYGRTDTIECTFSNFEFDNQENRIIKYTCKFIYNISSLKNQRRLQHILMRLNEVN